MDANRTKPAWLAKLRKLENDLRAPAKPDPDTFTTTEYAAARNIHRATAGNIITNLIRNGTVVKAGRRLVEKNGRRSSIPQYRIKPSST